MALLQANQPIGQPHHHIHDRLPLPPRPTNYELVFERRNTPVSGGYHQVTTGVAEVRRDSATCPREGSILTIGEGKAGPKRAVGAESAPIHIFIVVDEANRVPEPDMWNVLGNDNPAALVMIGDEKQLPTTRDEQARVKWLCQPPALLAVLSSDRTGPHLRVAQRSTADGRDDWRHGIDTFRLRKGVYQWPGYTAGSSPSRD